MALHTTQVTIGAGVTRVTTVRTPARQVIVQNNSAHDCRVGDSNTSATRGALLAAGVSGAGSPGGSILLGTLTAYNTDLREWYIAGTENDVIDVIYLS